jgi:hypothetical protein
MPEPPPGEGALRELALEFVKAEAYVGALLAEAAVGERARLTQWALERLASLRVLEYRLPVVAAYLAENAKGDPDAVADLARALAKRLDSGAKTAADGVRRSFAKVTPGNLAELMEHPTTAAIDARGTTGNLALGRRCTARPSAGTPRLAGSPIGSGMATP